MCGGGGGGGEEGGGEKEEEMKRNEEGERSKKKTVTQSISRSTPVNEGNSSKPRVPPNHSAIASQTWTYMGQRTPDPLSIETPPLPLSTSPPHHLHIPLTLTLQSNGGGQKQA